MESPYTVLAKRPAERNNPRHEETLLGHTMCVIASFREVFGSLVVPSRLALKWLAFFGLEKRDFRVFFANGVVACGLHDPGKANDGFYNDVTGRPGNQVIRHEHLSGLLIYQTGISDWMEQIPGVILDVVASAVISHHLKTPYQEFAKPRIASRRRILFYQAAVWEVLKSTASSLRVAEPASPEIPESWSTTDKGFRKHVKQVKERLYKFKRRLRGEDRLSRLQMAVRAALIVADSAGSALARENKPLEIWLGQAFSEDELVSGSDIQTKIIAPRIRQIEEGGKSFSWTGFQEAAETLSERALLLTPCGSGKTLAAWRWVRARLEREPVARVLFLYPTRATATEGFRDYVGWAPEADAALVSGTARFELERMFDNPSDDRGKRDFTTEDRLFAIGYWHKRIFSATVDQFLGFMQNSYRSVCLMPMVCDCAIVIDEVHSFDRNLFSALKRFLRAFTIPVLCMTASLPPRRIEDLQDCGLEVFPQEKAAFEDLAASANMPRYLVRLIDHEQTAAKIATNALSENRRVLWVVNTVDRCQRLARDLEALCYHSRFTLDDRTERHQEVVAAFQQKDRSVLAITTQVCEMSLDLDADVLISEAAPITSLIQRMGRCNRHARVGSDKVGTVYLYSPENNAPYNEEDLNGLPEFLKDIERSCVSQSHLEDLLDQYGPSQIEVERYASFLECGPWASSREESLREQHDTTVQAILDSHVGLYLNLLRQKSPVDGFMLPTPRKLARPEKKLGRHPMVVPSANYSSLYGLFSDSVESCP
jgi:CRISPR-associated endonuclease/helicase Cas3